jgi:hypothetical protein
MIQHWKISTIALAVLFTGTVFVNSSHAQSCGCEPTSPVCCETETKHVTIHVKTDNTCSDKGCWFRRPTLNVFGASQPTNVAQTATIPVVQSVPMMYTPAYFVQPMMTGVPVNNFLMTNAINPTSTNTAIRNVDKPDANCCEELSEELKGLTKQVKQINEDLDKMLLIVNRHDKVLEALLKERVGSPMQQ